MSNYTSKIPSQRLIKVLILSHSSQYAGGGEMSMIDIFDVWVKKGLVDPEFVIRKPLEGMAPELRKRKYKFYPIHYTNWSQRNPSTSAESIYRGAVHNSLAVEEIESIIEKTKPDVVMTNTIVAPWAALAAYFKKVPHIWFIREYGDIDHQHVFELGREKMFQDIDTLSDLVITNSRTLAKHVEQYINKDKITTIYTPFDVKQLQEKSRTKVKSPFKHKNSLKLVMIGKIAKSKGQHMAAQAVGELQRAGQNVELCLIGVPADPKDLEQLKDVIKKYEIKDRVHLVGFQENKVALGMVRLADIGIMASQQEAFGRVTFEYLAIGLPVVGSNSGATPELVEDGVCGYLYKNGDAKDLERQLLKYTKSRNLLNEHSDAAKKKAYSMIRGKYSAEKVLRHIKNILDNKNQQKNEPLNFSRRWLDYPLVAQQYIEDSGVISIKRLLYSRLRSKLKTIYLKGISFLGDATKNER